MRTAPAVAASTLLAAAANAQNGVVRWDIERRELRPKLGKRAGDTFEEVITNEQARGGYFATCQVGTPGQDLTLQLDTGSSDIWVPYSQSSVCEGTTTSTNACTFGSFNPDNSSTFDDVGEGQFDISYVDGSHSRGDYFTDAFEIGGANLSNLTMGLGIDTDIPYGLVGVGYALNEAIVSDTQSASSAYPNLPLAMQEEGLINTNAYSLWLNDLDSSTGNILFGGIDTEKYKGDLTRIEIYKDSNSGAFSSFIVALTSLEAYSSSGSDTLTSQSFPIAVVLDSGTTLSYLPTDLAEQVWQETGAVYSADIGLAVIPCSMQDSDGYFSFGFAGPNGPRINVTMDELVLDLTTGQAPTFSSGAYKGQDACEFGIQNFSSDPFLLGDTFLRSAYVVYDLENNEIGMAPTDFNATDSNIVAFESKGATIPSATVAANQNEVTQTPSFTQPAYAAASGFGTKDSAAALSFVMGSAQLVVVGASMVVAMLGSGVFLV
ncbi:Acid protease [Pleurostoma richardsiae]|uniref:Probable aspartic-type endopeptidase OPSB n=1 Tax=Pleurostoma richardsiae TaxID=41990 RepID=A0AA38VUV7_9PEZI|nr:Acid protease [Pleurostoma richardsiae]